MKIVDTNLLRSFQTLQDVPEEQLSWLILQSEQELIEDGAMLSTPDIPVPGVYFIIEGTCVVYTLQNGNQREIGLVVTGEITGYLPYSRGRYSSVYICATGSVQVMMLPYDKVRDLILNNFELTQTLVHVMCNRIKYVTALQSQNEKMMALGKLSAGMTHELNNPASANIRDASFLIKALRSIPAKIKELLAFQLTDKQYNSLFHFLEGSLPTKEKLALTLRDRRQLEHEMADWLETLSVKDAVDIAETFIDFTIAPEEIKNLGNQIPPDKISEVFHWSVFTMELTRTAENIQESSRRIADLVRSVKTYTHMDRGYDKQITDIHLGIKNTLVMLDHKIKKGNVRVEENFDYKLPQIKVLIGEMNQVWTNIIDNALDAMSQNPTGILIINTVKDKEFAKISVIDNGPGIPDAIFPMVFDPFFTTKRIGEGTGIGLDLVKRIIAQHRGNIQVQSRPGRTEFIVSLPIDI